MSELPLQGNGQIIMRDAAHGNVIYKTSFSSLFQEWLETDEAQTVTKGFENPFLLPYPLRPAEIEVILLDPRKNVRTSMKHTVNRIASSFFIVLLLIIWFSETTVRMILRRYWLYYKRIWLKCQIICS